MLYNHWDFTADERVSFTNLNCMHFIILYIPNILIGKFYATRAPKLKCTRLCDYQGAWTIVTTCTWTCVFVPLLLTLATSINLESVYNVPAAHPTIMSRKCENISLRIISTHSIQSSLRQIHRLTEKYSAVNYLNVIIKEHATQ